MAKSRSRAQQFAEWEEKPAKDYDPEADVPDESDEAGNSDESANENAGTEHYVAVGKSKLRRKEPAALGPQYRGSRVSRDALDQSSDETDEFEDAREDLDDDAEYDDPDEADLERDQLEDEEDAEIDSSHAFGESDDEKFKEFTFRGSSLVAPVKGKRTTRPKAADFLEDEDMGSESEEEEDDDDDEDDGSLMGNPMFDEDAEETSDDEGVEGSDDGDSDGTGDDEDEPKNEGAVHGAFSSGDDEEDDDDDDDGSDEESPNKAGASLRGNIQAMIRPEQNDVAGSLANAMQRDIAKGNAVRKQRMAFDAVLNVRIRLQKALVAVNSFSAVEEEGDQSEPYEAAEAAAVKLWNAIDTYRTGMRSTTGEKRKRAIEVSSTAQDIWDSMEATEQDATVRRKHLLDMWSNKVKQMRTVDAAGTRKDRSLVKGEKLLTVTLEGQLQDSERLIKRTRTPRSCAPIQVGQKVNEDPEIYDDADFYQQLLKELVDNRTADTSATGGQAATVRYAVTKEAKTKKHVDTKASKGRKMRFNVHEKLQNFMAPEDRRSWEQSAIDRFFGTLFGQKMMLYEDGDGADDVDQEMGGVVAEVDGLRLFK
ncbi:apoptosis-antagonizing transcription factor [Pseudomassariella vexata]|uniref:Protein BFR2 n=1 Tax=Pseudomassariella vexata TaxID=1141098 RepID=A0A1Y2DTJ5_9PEZI|nr:apoptosis-antagonizing transcription factor [Pseudomassariella vexata]ORY62598.1 apoptosis-antagonizing transcription factor [Pseudomassariella vexata]